MSTRRSKFVQTNVRLHRDDVKEIKRRAKKKGTSWQTELRATVRRALIEDGLNIVEVPTKT